MFLASRDPFRRGPGDTSRDTGVAVDSSRFVGGCDQPAMDTFVVDDAQGHEVRRLEIESGVLGSPSGGLSVNSDGTRVVGQFSLERAGWRDGSLVRQARRNGLDLPDSLSSIFAAAKDAEWRDQGRFLVFQGTGREGRWADLVVFDLEKGIQALVPRVSDVELGEKSLKYRPLGSKVVCQTALEDLPSLRQQGWYRKAVVRGLLDAKVEGPGPIEEAESSVRVGDIELPRRRA